MDMTQILAQTGGLRSMARELGVTEKEVHIAAAALVPAILGGFKKQAQSQPTGLEGLSELLTELGGGGLLDNVLAPWPSDLHRGFEVLGQIFGYEDVSRAVAENAAVHSGLPLSLLAQMLPMLAMLVAGYMAMQPGTSAARFASMLDWESQTNPLDDILRRAATPMLQPSGWPRGPTALR
jgi:hypothetical protein